MAPPFYAVLGVDTDADVGAIRDAYRSRIKDTHPDVSDDPDAPRRFKRLTAARNVLVDDTERARYDRLGHDEYVDRHLTSTVWAESSGTKDSETTRDSKTGTDTSSTSDDPETAQTESGTTRGPQDRNRRRHVRQSTVGTAATGEATWAQATRQGRSGTDEGLGPVGGRARRFETLRSIAPWLTIHVILLLSTAVGTSFTVVQLDRTAAVGVPGYLAGIVLFGLVLMLSILHLVTLTYS